MVVCDKYFVKIPNNMVRKLGEENSMVNEFDKIVLGMYSFLSRHKDLENQSRTSIGEIIEVLGYKPRGGKDGTNKRFVSAYNYLCEKGYIKHIRGNVEKIDNCIVCKIVEVEKNFFKFYYDKMDEVMKNEVDMLVYCNLLSRMGVDELDGLFFVQCYPSMEQISEDLGLSNISIQTSVNNLKKAEMIYCGNVGYVSKKNCGKRFANNVYTLTQEDYEKAINKSASYYRGKGYKIEDMPINYKRRPKEVVDKEKNEIRRYILENTRNEFVREEYEVELDMELIDILKCNTKSKLIKYQYTLSSLLKDFKKAGFNF